VTRAVSLLVAAMLVVPTVAPLVCDWLCGAQHAAAAAPAEGCHDHGGPPATTPAIAGAHACHELGVLPTSIVRDVLQLALPAVARTADEGADSGVGQALFISSARLNAHAPPPLALPLRI
jgi:hypothetical protein